MRLTLSLSEDEKNALLQLAYAESRDPRWQALVIIRQKLEELRLLQPKTLKREGANNDHN